MAIVNNGTLDSRKKHYAAWSSTFAAEADFTITDPNDPSTTVTVTGGYRAGAEVVHSDALWVCMTEGTTEEPGTGSDNSNWRRIDNVAGDGSTVSIDSAGNTITIDGTATEIPVVTGGSVTGTTLTLTRNGSAADIEVTGLPSGGTTTTIAAEVDSTLTGDGTSGSPLSVANPFTDADETKLDGISAGADVTPSWVPDSDPSYLTAIPDDVVRDSDVAASIRNNQTAPVQGNAIFDALAGKANIITLAEDGAVTNVSAGDFLIAGSELYYATAGILNVNADNVAAQADAFHVTGTDATPSWVPDSNPNYLTAIPADVLRDADFALNPQGQVASINLGGTVRGFSGGSGSGGVTVQDEGTALSTTATTLNFTGDGVTASGTGATKTITINTGSGGGGGSAAEIMYSNLPVDQDPGNPTDNPSNWQESATFATTQVTDTTTPFTYNPISSLTGLNNNQVAITAGTAPPDLSAGTIPGVDILNNGDVLPNTDELWVLIDRFPGGFIQTIAEGLGLDRYATSAEFPNNDHSVRLSFRDSSSTEVSAATYTVTHLLPAITNTTRLMLRLEGSTRSNVSGSGNFVQAAGITLTIVPTRPSASATPTFVAIQNSGETAWNVVEAGGVIASSGGGGGGDGITSVTSDDSLVGAGTDASPLAVSHEIVANAAVGAHTAERLQPAHTVDNSYEIFNGFIDNGALPDDLQGVSSTFVRPAVEYTRGSNTMIIWFADATISSAGITTGTELSFGFTGLTPGFRVTGEVVEVDTAERPSQTKVGIEFPAGSPAIEILEQGTVIPNQRLPGNRIIYGTSLFQPEYTNTRSDWALSYTAATTTLVLSLSSGSQGILPNTLYRATTSSGTFIFNGNDVTGTDEDSLFAGSFQTWTVSRFVSNSATADVSTTSQSLERGAAEAHQITETTFRAVGYDANNQLQGQEFLEFSQFRPSDLDQIVNRPTIRFGNSAYGEAARFTLEFNGFPQFTYTVNSGTLRFADVTGDNDDITDDTTGFFGIANNADIGEILQFGLVGSSGSPGNTVNTRIIYTVTKAGDNRYTVTTRQDFDTHLEFDSGQGIPDVPTTTVASGFAAELRLLTTPRWRRAESYSIGDTVSYLDSDGISRLYVSQQSSNLSNAPGLRTPISVTNISVNANQGNRIELVLPQGDRFFDIPTEIYHFAWTNTVGGVATRYSGSILGADIDVGISNQTETLHFEYDATFVADDLSNLNDKPFPFDLAPTSGTNSDFSFTDSGEHFWASAGSFGTRQIQEVRAIADSRIARASPLTLRGLGVERVGTDTFALAPSIGGTTITGVTISNDTNPPRVSFTLTSAATTAFNTRLTALGAFNGNPYYILFGTNTDNSALVTFRAENHNFGSQAIISANQTPEFTRWLETLPDSAFTSSARDTLRYSAFGGVVSVATADFGGRVRADVDEDGHPILVVDHNPLVNNVVSNQEDWDEIASHITYSSTLNITSGITDGAAYDFRVNPVIHTSSAIAAQFSDVWRGGSANAYLYLGSRRNISGLAPAGNEVYDVLSYFGGGYRHFDRAGLINLTGEQGRAPNPSVEEENGTAQVQLVNLTGGPITIALQGGGSETFQSGQVVSNVRTLVRATGLNQAGTAYSGDSASRAIIEIQGVWRSSTNGAQFDQDDIGRHRGLRFQIQTRPGISEVTTRLFGGSSLTANVPLTLSTFDSTTGLFRHGVENTGGGGGLSVVRNQAEFDALALTDGLQVMNFGSGNVVVGSSGGGTTTVGLGNGNSAAANIPRIRRTENGGGTVYRWNLVVPNAATSTAAARGLNQGETFGPLEYTITATPPDGNTVWTTAVTDTGEQINVWKRNINNAGDFWNLTTSATTSAFGTANADSNVITGSNAIGDFLDAVLGTGVRPSGSNVQVNSSEVDLQANVYLRVVTGGTSTVDTVIVPNQLGVYNATDTEWRVITTAAPVTA